MIQDDYQVSFSRGSVVIKGNFFSLKKVGPKKVCPLSQGHYTFDKREACIHHEAVLYYNFRMPYSKSEGCHVLEDGAGGDECLERNGR